MADELKFLLGFGERLTEPVPPPGGGNEPKSPYTVDEARDRLVPLITSTAEAFSDLPDDACPNNEAVAIITLHPQALSKSAFPGRLLREVGLETIGSRPARVTPDQWTRKGDPTELESTALFVAGDRGAFARWASGLGSWNERTRGSDDLAKIENVRAANADDRIQDMPEEIDAPLLEIALHCGPNNDAVLDAFGAYAKRLGMEPDFDRRLYAGQLCFLPMRGVRNELPELGKFAFLRVARLMPSLRPVAPMLRAVLPRPFAIKLPDSEPVDPGLRAAVFDGGVTVGSSLARWIDSHDAGDVGAAVPAYLRHGSNVSSALLFGHVSDGVALPAPFGKVDHFRVLDETSARDEDLFDVLTRVRDVIQSNTHQFINLSIGPEIPIDDDEVHTWTSVLDDLLSDGDRLLTVAAGNGGDRDAALRYDRVQVPSDSVNAMAIGSADCLEPEWSRAWYSSTGPGRSPGLVKPDALAFGGVEQMPFGFVSATDPNLSDCDIGTSFASPAALRLAMGIRAHFGDRLTPMGIKALLVHATEDRGIERTECGWGRLPSELESFVACPDGTARIVYQGELTPKQYLKALIPLPVEDLEGYVEIKTTLCYATPIDAAHPGNYTRAGMDVVFFPHDERVDPESKTPGKIKSDPYFQLKEFSTEQELRHDAHKWETTLHRAKRKLASSLSNPFFTIHYNPRQNSGPTSAAEKVRYALVVSVTCKNVKDLYDKIARRYQTQIQPLTPLVRIPIRTQT
jgi:hypothetical protein